MKWSTISMMAGIGISVNAVSLAKANETGILSLLKKADSSVAHGTIVYRMNTQIMMSPPTEADIQHRIRERQNRLKQDNAPADMIESVPDDVRDEIKQIYKQRKESDQKVLIYKSMSVFKVISEGPLPTAIYNGPNKIIVEQKQKRMIISANPPEVLPDGTYLGGLSPRASFEIGRGLSNLADLKVVRSGNRYIVKGRQQDSTLIQATLDPDHGYMAQSIIRLHKGKPIGQWKFDSLRRTSEGVWLPGKAHYASLSQTGEALSFRQFDFIRASFQPPKDEMFQILLKGYAILDNRLGKPILYKQWPAGVHDLNDLLKITGKELEGMALVERDYERQATNRLRIRVILSFIFLATVIASVFAFWSTLKNRRIE